MLTASAVLSLLSGCSKEQDETEYNIYSNGTTYANDENAVPDKEKEDYADFYIPDGMVTDYYSQYTFSEDEQELYNEVKKSLGNLKASNPLTTDSMEYQKILDVIRLEQLGFPHVSGRSLEYNGAAQQFEVKISYRLTADEISSMNMAAEKAAKDIIAQLTPDMDDYEKLKFFHDYLIRNCETDTSDAYADTIYGTLVRKKALCEGYAKTFSYLCNLAGIENTIVTGKTYVAHMWNMVKLGGNWYHVDVTWDKSEDQLRNAFPNVILYQYFMVTDSVIENNHVISQTPAEPPQAFGTSENYFVREEAEISSRDELLEVCEKAIIKAVKNHETSAMVKFETTDIYLASINDLKNEEVFTPVIKNVLSECGENIHLSWTDYYGQYRILTFIIGYPD